MAHDTFTLGGKHTSPSGAAHRGSVRVTPNGVVRDAAGKVVLSGPETVPLDASGAWSVVLPCDSAGLDPATGIGYRVEFALHATRINPVSFYATAELAGTVLDASEIVSTTVLGAATTTVTVGTSVTFAALARNPDLLVSGPVTRDANGAATSAAVTWPDGTPGTYTALVVSAAFPGAVDSYSITYGAPVTKTYTQPTITRDANGSAVTVPAITVT